MDILGYEIDIYLVIVLIAVVFVACIILLMSRSITAKKAASKKKKGIKGAKERAGLLAEKSHNQLAGKTIEQAMPNPHEKPVEGKPAETTAKLATKPVGDPTQEATAKPAEEPSKMPILQIRKAKEVEEETPAEKSRETDSAAGSGRAWETDTLKDQAEKTGMVTPAMSRLGETESNKETKTEEEKPEETKEEDSVLDIFGEEDEEESELSVLAAGLNDVDLDTLLKLSSEVSEIVPKSNLAKQRREQHG